MNELVKKDQNELIQYLLNKESGLDLPKPFERDIYLFDTYVAGTTHIKKMEIIGSRIKEGTD